MSRTNVGIHKIRAGRKKSLFSSGLLARNPVLASGMLLAPVVVAATTVKTALALGLTMLIVTMPTLLLVALVGRHFPAWLRPPLYVMVSALLLVPASALVMPIAPTIFDSMGMYFSLMAVNAVLLTHGERVVLRRSVGPALLEGLAYCVGFLLASVLVGAVRELLASNTLWGLSISLPFKISAFALPFAGFLVVGMLSGMGRYCRELYYRITNRRKRAAHASEEVSV